ncbi:MAG: H/ACA ribonucleoprotein complex subunit GAR1 [Thermoplasmata archaeon]
MPNSPRRIGKVLGVREKKLIVKLNRDVPLSTKVYDEDGRLIGKVVRLFGPTKAPFAAIDSKGITADEIYVR